jgi:uracil-DNA glycosylase
VIAELAAARIGATHNFYREGARAPLRRDRLAAYLEERAGAPLLLVAEAPGWRGTRVSGIPLTSERQLTGAGPAEATATIVHSVLAELGLAGDVLLWNVVPTHPHLPGRPETNRRPTRAEVEASAPFVRRLARGREVVPVGRLAHAALGGPYVRHPSHGGAAAFRAGLRRIAAQPSERSGMDERTIREAAETHARATVERDYGTAGSYLSPEMQAAAGEVMQAMPRPLTGSEVLSVEGGDGAYTARIRYAGEEEAATTVDSRWEDLDGKPTIVGLEVVEQR